MQPVITLALKDLKVLFRVKAALFFAVGWPLCMSILFGLMFGGSGEVRKLPIAAVDEDRSEASRQFITELGGRDAVDLLPADRAQATDLVRRGKRVAAVVVPAGFGVARAHLLRGAPPRLELLADPSHRAETAMVEGVLYGQSAEAMQSMVAQLRGPAAGSTNMNANANANANASAIAAAGAGAPAASWKPVEIERHEVATDRQGPRSSYDVSFVQGLVWGLIGCAMTFAVSLVTERTHGTLIRLRMSPMTAMQLLGGKALACFLALMLMQSLLLGLGIFVFGIRVASPIALIVSMICAALAFVGVMMLVASFGRNEQATSGAGWALLMPMSLFGGGMVPLFVMPAWMMPFRNFSLLKWAVVGFEGAIWRGFGPADFLLPWTILTAAGVAGFLAGARHFKRAAA